MRMVGQLQKLPPHFTLAVLALLAVLSLTGCSAVREQRIRAFLDPNTAVTATMLPAALEYTSNIFNVPPAARIDAQVGPVEINRSGKYSYLLWVSAERADHRGQNRVPSIRLLDGKRVLLERRAQDALPGFPLSVAPYSTVLDSGSQYTFDLSPEELRALKVAGRLGLSVSFDAITWHLLESWEGSAENFNPLIASAFPLE